MILIPLMAVTLAFYSGLRLLFLLWNRAQFAGLRADDVGFAFIAGLRFDLSAVATLALPALLLLGLGALLRRDWRRPAAVTFLLFQVPLLIVNLGDVEFVQFMGRRLTRASLAVVTELQGKVLATVVSSAGLFLISLVFTCVYVALIWRMSRPPATAPRRGSWKKQVGVGFLLALGTVVAARGGVQRKPIGFAHAQVFAVPALNQLTLNSSFTFLQSLKRAPLPREKFMSTEEMIARMNGTTPGESLLEGKRPAAPQNVVLIILESFGLELMGEIHGDGGYTPFLDGLAREGLFFPHAFANGRRSIEGIAALLGGIPALMTEPFISSPHATTNFEGWGTALAPKGYFTAFYHGGRNGTMYFDQFSRSAGIRLYYGANEYPDAGDHDGTWGIWDRPFFLNLVRDLKTRPEPFAVTVFSLSSHHPYRVPDSEKGRFPKGTNEIHEVIGYTDDALRGFFEAARREPWFERTLFIVTSDHIFKPERPGYRDDLGNYRVPLLFYHPAMRKWPAVDLKEPVQHIDVLPSVLDFLGMSPRQMNLMGRSVFRSGPRHVVLASDGFYWLVTRDHVLTEDPSGRASVKAVADHLRPPRSETARPIEDPELERELLSRLRATRQYFSEGLWDNRLYYPAGR